jgi:hypothetical protein
MSVKYIDFTVTGDPASARATAERALTERKFKVTWTSDWAGTAERGNKIANVALGALAQYFKVGVSVMGANPGTTIVRIERQSSGWAGGAIGASRTTRNINSLRQELESTFSSAGVLQGVSDG